MKCFISLALLAVMASATVSAATTYTKVTDINSLVENDQVIILSESQSLGLGAVASSQRSGVTNITPTDGSITLEASSGVSVFTVGISDSYYTFFENSTNEYLSSNNSLNLTSSSTACLYYVSITDGNALIQDVSNLNSTSTKRQILAAASSNIFKSYAQSNASSSSYAKVQIYKATATTDIASPVFTPAAGEIAKDQTITITCATADATIYYTLDSTTPSAENGTPYNGPFTLANEATVKAIAISNGTTSGVTTAKYVFPIESIRSFIASIPSTPRSIATEVTIVAKYGEFAVVTDGTTDLLINDTQLADITLNSGDRLSGICGTYTTDTNVPTMTNIVASTFANPTAGTPVDPITTTSVDFDYSANMLDYVELSNVSISYNNSLLEISDESGASRSIKNLFGIEYLAPGENLTVIGIVGRENSAAQIWPISIIGEGYSYTPKGYTLITKLTDLALDNCTYVIAAGDIAMSAEYVNDRVLSSKVEIDGATLLTSSTTAEFSVTKSDAGYIFEALNSDKPRYLKINKTDDNEITLHATDSPVLHVAFDESGNAVIAYNSESTYELAYNSSSDMFRNYSATSSSYAALQIYRHAPEQVELTVEPVTINERAANKLSLSYNYTPTVVADSYKFLMNDKVLDEAAATDGIVGFSADYVEYTTNPSFTVVPVTAGVDGEAKTLNSVALDWPQLNMVEAQINADLSFIVKDDKTSAEVVACFKFAANADISDFAYGFLIDEDENLYFTEGETYMVSTGQTVAISTDNKADLSAYEYAPNPAWTVYPVFYIANSDDTATRVMGIGATSTSVKGSTDKTSGVESPIIDNADSQVEYYDLQGRHVNNPEHGIYIRRQGSKVSKVVINQ